MPQRDSETLGDIYLQNALNMVCLQCCAAAAHRAYFLWHCCTCLAKASTAVAARMRRWRAATSLPEAWRYHQRTHAWTDRRFSLRSMDSNSEWFWIQKLRHGAAHICDNTLQAIGTLSHFVSQDAAVMSCNKPAGQWVAPSRLPALNCVAHWPDGRFGHTASLH